MSSADPGPSGGGFFVLSFGFNSTKGTVDFRHWNDSVNCSTPAHRILTVFLVGVKQPCQLCHDVLLVVLLVF